MNADIAHAKQILLRDHCGSTEAKESKKPSINSLDDIIEQKPSTKLVREYFKTVLANIAVEEDSQFKQ